MSTLIEQVREARATFNEAHAAAEKATAEWVDLRRQTGTNEKARAEAAKSMPADDYARLTELGDEAERVKVAAVAKSERAEKNLNVLREELQHETATINRAWAEIADRTAIQYAKLQMAPPARPMVIANHNPDDPEF